MSSRVNKHKRPENIYLDNAAATPIDSVVQKEVLRAMSIYGNPSSYNDLGRRAAKEIGQARLAVARFLGAHQDEIVFTGSGSEANNLVLIGSMMSMPKGSEIITTPIEHQSVLEPIKALEGWGFKVKYLKVSKDGVVDLRDLEQKLSLKTALVSIMYANNEIGTIEPIAKASKIIKRFNSKILFHTDACQATEYLDMNVNHLGVDLLSFNGSKIYGPRGVGALYVRKGTVITPLIRGGGHERGLRAGTENLSAILGLAKAINIIQNGKINPPAGRAGIKNDNLKLKNLRDYFISEIWKSDERIRLNGSEGDNRLPNNINISIPNLDSENILLELDKYGIHAGSGSACTSHSVEPSHVLKAIGVKEPYLDGAIRFSLGRKTTKKDIDYVLEALPKIIKELKERYKK